MANKKDKIYNGILGFVTGRCLGSFYDRMEGDDIQFRCEDITEGVEELFGYMPCANVLDLMDHYSAMDKRLSPEDFSEYLLELSEKNRLDSFWHLHYVTRNAVELIKEGMNPRIAALFSPVSMDAFMLTLPVALYHCDNEENAYNDVLTLGNVVSSPEGARLAAIVGKWVVRVINSNMDWNAAKDELLSIAIGVDKTLYFRINKAIGIGERAKDFDALCDEVLNEEFFDEVDPMKYLGIKGFYVALAFIEKLGPNFCKLMSQGISAITKFDSANRKAIRIYLSVYAAMAGLVIGIVDGSGGIPGFFKEGVGKAFNIESRTDSFIKTIERKRHREAMVAKKVAPQIEGENIDETVLYDKILAGLIAGTLGNVMGSPLENMDYTDIEKEYGRVESILDYSRLETEDDCDVTLMWAEAIVERGGAMLPQDLAKVWVNRMIRKKFFPCLRNAYDLLKAGFPAHGAGHWNLVTGSTVMACAPVGILNAGDPEQAAFESREVSYMYQRGNDVHAAAIISSAYAEALSQDATVDSVIKAALDTAILCDGTYFKRHTPNSIAENIKKALRIAEKYDDVYEVRQELYENCLEWNPIDPIEVITLTLAIFKVAKGDVWKSMIGGTNLGRDSDTIANIASALAGFLAGTQAIPSNVTDLINDNLMAKYKDIATELTLLNIDRIKRYMG